MQPCRIRGLIVDDEPAARRGIRLLLENDPDVEVVGECSNGTEAVSAVERLRPDLLFLDVQMPGMSGFDVLARVTGQIQPQVIFVTAYDRYALDAFDAHAVDYLLKPFSDKRFYIAVQRAKQRLWQCDLSEINRNILALLRDVGRDERRAHQPPATGAPAYLERLVVRSAEQSLLLPVDEIDWIEAADDYLQVHIGDQTHLLRESLGAIEKKLDPNRFVRIHRSTLVKLDRIHKLQPYFRGEYLVVLQDGTKLKLARRRRQQLARALGQEL